MSGSHKKGKLIIPDNAPWAETLIAEFERFPYGTHDDQVDACALAFNQLWEYGGGDTMMTIPADAEAVM
jgi:predicted phage terminase large subunit-like protein